jgi:hypothetical protein
MVVLQITAEEMQVTLSIWLEYKKHVMCIMLWVTPAAHCCCGYRCPTPVVAAELVLLLWLLLLLVPVLLPQQP